MEKKLPVWLLVILGAIVILVPAYAFISGNKAVEPPAQTQTDQPQILPSPAATPAPEPQKPKIETITGVYVGRADNNFVEVDVNNKPVIFLAPYEKEKELGLENVNEDTNITLDYYVNENAQNVLVAVKK